MKILIISLAVILLIILVMAVQNARTPSDIGLTAGRLASLPKSPNAVSSQAEDEGKRVSPFPFKENLEESKQSLKHALYTYGNIEILTEESHYIHAVSTTKTMKYRDDLEFHFDEQAGVIHFRSASRVGYSDGGLNRERYNSLMDLYQ